jgi:hypothetical protein
MFRDFTPSPFAFTRASCLSAVLAGVLSLSGCGTQAPQTSSIERARQTTDTATYDTTKARKLPAGRPAPKIDEGNIKDRLRRGD